MCLGAIYWARLDRVYYANTRADAATIGFDDDHIYREFDKPIDGRSRAVHPAGLGGGAADLPANGWKSRTRSRTEST